MFSIPNFNFNLEFRGHKNHHVIISKMLKSRIWNSNLTLIASVFQEKVHLVSISAPC